MRTRSQLKGNRIDGLEAESQAPEVVGAPDDNYHIALACFSAISPIIGNLNIWP